MITGLGVLAAYGSLFHCHIVIMINLLFLYLSSSWSFFFLLICFVLFFSLMNYLHFFHEKTGLFKLPFPQFQGQGHLVKSWLSCDRLFFDHLPFTRCHHSPVCVAEGDSFMFRDNKYIGKLSEVPFL